MLPYLKGRFGNAASREHAFGWDARDAVDDARCHVAALINAKPNEIIFTAGATESIHIALYGLFSCFPPRISPAVPPASTSAPPHREGILASPVEHQAVRAACGRLASQGTPVDILGVDPEGRIDTDVLAAALRTRPAKLLCLMAANNETGVLFPIRESAAIAHARGCLLFTDAAQALGRTVIDAAADGFDLACFSAHKVNGPKGIGALFLRDGGADLSLDPLLSAGGQEGGLRGGTANVAAIVGFGEACRLAREEMARDGEELRALRDTLEALVLAGAPEARVNGGGADRLPNTSNLLFPGVDARILIRDMDDVAVSSRSACSSGSSSPSHVLKAMALSDEDAFASVRFSLGKSTASEDIAYAAEKVVASYRKLVSTARKD